MQTSSLKIAGPEKESEIVRQVLENAYPAYIRTLCGRQGIVIRMLDAGEKFSDVSPLLRRIAAGVDAWPVPPAGLFVVEERRVYLRALSPMTIAHEFAHGLDLALGLERGGSQYLSSTLSAIRTAFARATAFVTPYAASACDEFFAECVRAYVEVNDEHSLWPRVTRERLKALTPSMHGIIETLFDDAANRALALDYNDCAVT